MDSKELAAPAVSLEQRIRVIRGLKVMLDRDLAELYGVPTKVLNQAVRRRRSRFPPDFMFRLTRKEVEDWRSQIVTSNLAARKSLRRAPYAFTEHGILMLSSVLHGERAVQVNIAIMRAFNGMRRMLRSNAELAARLDQLERQYDARFKEVFTALKGILAPPDPPKAPIGFKGR